MTLIIAPRAPIVILPPVTHPQQTSTQSSVAEPVHVEPLSSHEKVAAQLILGWFLVLVLILTFAIFSFEQEQRRFMAKVLLAYLATTFLILWIVKHI